MRTAPGGKRRRGLRRPSGCGSPPAACASSSPESDAADDGRTTPSSSGSSRSAWPSRSPCRRSSGSGEQLHFTGARRSHTRPPRAPSGPGVELPGPFRPTLPCPVRRAPLLAQLPSHGASRVQRHRMDVDVVVLGVLHDRLDQVPVGAHAAAARSISTRRNQSDDDSSGLGRAADVDVSSGRRERDVGDGELEADLLLTWVEPDRGRAAAVRVSRARNLRSPRQSRRERPPPSSASAATLSTSVAITPTHRLSRKVRCRVLPPSPRCPPSLAHWPLRDNPSATSLPHRLPA